MSREEAAEDRRGAYAAITASGLERLRLAQRSHVALVRQHFLNRFSPAELALMAGFWARLGSGPDEREPSQPAMPGHIDKVRRGS